MFQRFHISIRSEARPLLKRGMRLPILLFLSLAVSGLVSGAEKTGARPNLPLTPHEHHLLTTTWANPACPVPPTNPDQVAPNCEAAHQHFNLLHLGGYAPDPGLPSPVTALSQGNFRLSWDGHVTVWDNRNRRTRPLANGFSSVVGHGFIDESGYGYSGGLPAQPTFYIDTTNVIPAADAVAAARAVRNAFILWSQWVQISYDDRNRVTGLEFREVADPALADVRVIWLADANDVCNFLAGTSVGAPPVTVRFDNDCPWHHGLRGETPDDQFHFYSTIIHEVGHVVGMSDQRGADTDDVMIWQRSPGCVEAGGAGPCFIELDSNAADGRESVEGAAALYTIPAPDFGDAPDDPDNPNDYPTRLVSNGARAPTILYEWLDSPMTSPSNTTREPDRLAVDESDIGCHIGGLYNPPSSPVIAGYVANVFNKNATRYTVPFSRLFITIWVDWNIDGDWADPQEQLFLDEVDPLLWPTDANPNAQDYAHEITVPPDTKEGITWMRCRLLYGYTPGAGTYLTSTNGYAGLAPIADSPDNGGEVEDLRVQIVKIPEGLWYVTTLPQVTDDADEDGVVNALDNCEWIANADQANLDGDARGDVCDLDDDADGAMDALDSFPVNPAETDDTDQDGFGNNADPDDDNDTLLDGADQCPEQVEVFNGILDGDGCADSDYDSDGWVDSLDGCPVVVNLAQSDTDGDGLQDACDPQPTWAAPVPQDPSWTSYLPLIAR